MITWEQLHEIEEEKEQISKLYEIFNEDTRLNQSKSSRVEFLTTVKYIEKYLKSGDKILDIGAGAGEYSLYFANKGYEVNALELTDSNIISFKKKLHSDMKIDLIQGNAMDLSNYKDNAFDVVLLLGPLYHLHNEADRQKCIAEAKRVCTPNGRIFFAFISNDMVILTELMYSSDFFIKNSYDHETFKLEDFPFVFFTVDKCREILSDGGINILSEIASDGLSELMHEKINAMDDISYEQYLKYHFYCCEKPELLGRSNHLLFIGRK